MVKVCKTHSILLVFVVISILFVSIVLAQNPGHPANRIGGTTDAERTFNSTGRYTFLGDLVVGGNLTVGSSLLFVNNRTGNVGIGTTNPTARLDVNGNIKWGTGRGLLTTDQGASIELGGSGIPYIDFSNDMTTDFDMRIQLTGDDALLIDGGNVGIGTSNPTSKLHVIGDITSSAYVRAGQGLCIGTSCITSFTSIGGAHWTASGNNIYNTNTGNVGIGTTNPQAKLHISTGDSTTPPFRIDSITVGGSTSCTQVLGSSNCYRRPITIDNTQNPNTLTNYQVLVIVDTQTPISQGKMRSDCGDIRFTDSDGLTLLPHYIYTNITNYASLSYSWGILGCNSPRTMIRVVVPNIPANSIKTIYMYYGNPSLTYNNQLNNIFSDTIGVMSATLPSGRDALSCVPYGDSIYCFGGREGTNYLNQIVRYNVTSNTVTVMSATLPSGRDLLSCAPHGDSIYCFGGYNGSRLNQIVRYNVTSNTVTVMSATLPSGRYFLSCAPYGDSIYCFGGWDGSLLNQIVRYNVISNTVTVMSATLPSGRYSLSCAPYGDSIYCFGGADWNYLNQIVRYNVISNTVTVMSATLPSSRYDLSCAPYGDSIYCFGGFSETGRLNQIVRYNVISNTITTMSATLPSARNFLSCAPYGDSIYCFGGNDGSNFLNQIVRYALRFSSPEPTTTVGSEEIPTTQIQSTPFFIQPGSGNVGIGTTNPGYRLDVVGSVGANAYYTRSDISLKTNITKIDEKVLDRLTQLEPVRFKWKDTGEVSVGLIAQEVEKIFPELVYTTPNGTKSIDYGKFTVYLINAIKEQQRQINELKNLLNQSSNKR